MPSHSRCSRTGLGSGDLSIDDVLYEILLHLSAKDLCRLRLVCRRWRSLLSDPHFIAAHASRHPGPLIVAGYVTSRWREGFIADIVDLSGRVVKRIRATENERVKSIQHDLICTTVVAQKRYRLLNLATGAVHLVPGGLSEQHVALRENIIYHRQFLVFGQVASTGEYKLLRIFETGPRNFFQQLCEVFTHDGSNSTRWWTSKEAPPSLVKLDRWGSVVVDGIVYFLSHEPSYIPSFDLEKEEWNQTLRGPLSILDENWGDLSVATLTGCLVVVHHVRHCRIDTRFLMDLWFLMDEGLWVKNYSLRMSVRNGLNVHPLLVLDDGKIALVYTEGTFIRTYDPRTDTTADIAEIRDCVAVGLFTGSLLRIATGTS